MALGAFVALGVVALGGFVAYVASGVVDGGRAPVGKIYVRNVRAPVDVAFDERGIPHIRARDVADAYFTEGYLQGCDRLFQLDVYRRLIDGRLSEVFGWSTIDADLRARIIDIAGIERAQRAALDSDDRRNLEAFVAGINVARETRPLAPEFRLLGYRPEPWTIEDTFATSFATVLALTDTWDEITARADVIARLGPAARDAFFSISDPAYDTPAGGVRPAPIAPLPALPGAYPDRGPLARVIDDGRLGLGSNNMAAGSALTTTHRALLANDPHLELHMPGIWWLADLAAPNFHVAGATLAGVPGIVLGHNAHVAWGATNGTVETVRVFRERFNGPASDRYRADAKFVRAEHRVEHFNVRFGTSFTHDYLRTRHGFVFRDDGAIKYAAEWTADRDRRSSLAEFAALGRTTSAAQARRVLARYPGPPQNFVLADDGGRAAYVLAGEMPIDRASGLTVHDGTRDASTATMVADTRLPQLRPSRRTFVVTANQRVYGQGYPYRLSAGFEAPYRARRIVDDLAHRPLDLAAFARVQADVTSLPERDLARSAVRAIDRRAARAADLAPARATLATFDGRFTGSSHAAVVVTALRRAATERLARTHLPPELVVPYLADNASAAFVTLMRALRERPRGWVPHDDYDAFLIASLRDALAGIHAAGRDSSTWAEVGARIAEHPLANFGWRGWNGMRFPGLGGSFTPHVQARANAQSFRAVWDVGRWDNGGIVIPQGESGEPGSPHYRDLAPEWLAQTLHPLPFSDAAVARATRARLSILPELGGS